MTRDITILVDVPSVHAYYRDVISGVARFCREQQDVRLRFASDEWELVGSTLSIDGVIAVVLDEVSHRQATRFGKPVVNISSRAGTLDVPSVVSDNVAIGVMAAEHLLQEGFTSFACHMTSHVQFSIDRCKGFVDRIRRAQCPCFLYDTATKTLDNEDTEAIVRQIVAWLRSLPKPVGLFTHNDIRGVMLLDLCRAAKIAVPGEVGVIGVDNDEFLDLLSEPTLSSVNPNAATVGYKAAEVLVAAIRGDSGSHQPVSVAPLSVVQRESTQLIFERDELLARAVRFIRANAVPFLTISDVLAEIPISRRVLERRFRERLGSSPADEILRVRIEHAKRLLTSSNIPLKQVAKEIGYGEYPNFAIAFRREVGSTPSDFRKVHQPPERTPPQRRDF